MNRIELIEVAATRPTDISSFYDKYLIHVGECAFLSDDTPEKLPIIIKGKLKYYDPKIVPFVLADKNPMGTRKCGFRGCMNPLHVR